MWFTPAIRLTSLVLEPCWRLWTQSSGYSPSGRRGHLNLLTRYGPLDVLGTIGRSLGYAELLSHSIDLDITEDVRIRVLDLETIIALKEELGGEKDRAVLPTLRRTLEERRRR